MRHAGCKRYAMERNGKRHNQTAPATRDGPLLEDRFKRHEKVGSAGCGSGGRGSGTTGWGGTTGCRIGRSRCRVDQLLGFQSPLFSCLDTDVPGLGVLEIRKRLL